MFFTFSIYAHNVKKSYEYPISNPFYSTLSSGFIDSIEYKLNFNFDKSKISHSQFWLPFLTNKDLLVSSKLHLPYRELCFDFYSNRKPVVKSDIPAIYAKKTCSRVYLHKASSHLFSDFKEAPLVFILAGLGSSNGSNIVKLLTNTIYQSGAHVITINSPFIASFQLRAMANPIPGAIFHDSLDVYRFMKEVFQAAKKQYKLKTKNIYLTGYSYGGLESLFIARADHQKPFFNFKRVLAINPPVNLISSSRLLDSYFKGAEHDQNAFEQGFRIASFFSDPRWEQKGEDRLFKFQWLHKLVSTEQAKSIIGYNFHEILTVTSAATDSVYNFNFLSFLRKYSLYEKAIKERSSWSFNEYLNQILWPFYKQKGFYNNVEDFNYKNSMKALNSFLKKSSYIRIHHNKDDIIMTEEEIKYIISLFQERARIFPSGGHLGNLWYPNNVGLILKDLFNIDYQSIKVKVE